MENECVSSFSVLNSIIGAPFVDNRAKLDSLKNMMPAPSLGAEQCNLIG